MRTIDQPGGYTVLGDIGACFMTDETLVIKIPDDEETILLDLCEEAAEREYSAANAFGETLNDWWSSNDASFGDVVEAGFDWSAADDATDNYCDIAEQDRNNSLADIDFDLGLDF